MPEFECVRCVSCMMFQAKQKTKKRVFVCKICGEKQSIRKVYGVSYKAKDIRTQVMELNRKQGEGQMQQQEEQMNSVSDEGFEWNDDDENVNECSGVSKWTRFTQRVESSRKYEVQCDVDNGANEEDFYVLEAPTKKKRRSRPKNKSVATKRSRAPTHTDTSDVATNAKRSKVTLPPPSSSPSPPSSPPPKSRSQVENSEYQHRSFAKQHHSYRQNDTNDHFSSGVTSESPSAPSASVSKWAKFVRPSKVQNPYE